MIKLILKPFSWLVGRMHMNKLCKALIMCVAVMAIVYCGFILITQDPNASIFFAESVVDNAIFCFIFILVVLTTGINC